MESISETIHWICSTVSLTKWKPKSFSCFFSNGTKGAIFRHALNDNMPRNRVLQMISFFIHFGSILMSSLTENTTWFRVTYWESASKAIKSRQVENRVFKRQFWSIFEFAACKNMDIGPLVLLILPQAFHFYAYMTLTCVWYYKKYAKCVQIWNMYCRKKEKL